ncbi:MAG TPA: hypothetical protein PLK30_04670 [Blastocatellia bacterium]|nr:hypothetical protein [Blastocatellia bacterium]
MLAVKLSNKWFYVLAVGAVVMALGSVVITRPQQGKAENPVRAKELIRQSREAAGLEALGGGVQTLAFKAKVERFIKYYSVQSPTKVVENDKTLSGKIEAEFAPPDKFRLKRKTDTLSGFDVSYTEILSGDLAWRDPPMTVRSFGPDRRVIDVGDVERTMLMQTRTAKQQIALYTLGWLLQTPTSVSVDMTYGGVVDFEGRKCEAVVVDGQDGLRTVLVFDQQTRLLLGLGIGLFDSIRETVVVEAVGFDRRFMRDTFARARQERIARTKPAQQHEVFWRFLDHSTIGGVTLPHRVKITLDGRLIEELTINEYKVNQPINPKRFEGKPEVKY